MAIDNLVHLELKEAEEQRKRFEARYQMEFEAFKRAALWATRLASIRRSFRQAQHKSLLLGRRWTRSFTKVI